MMKIDSVSNLLLLLSMVACTAVPKEHISSSYQEKHRPQFHFTPPSQWMNDPNGMFLYEGEYHLFYQYYPDSNVWGPMHWGHAVSTDMVRWEHLPIALYPDSLGYIFSGSAVVDWENSSGFGAKDNPPIVAIYTYHDPAGEKSGRIDFQYQGIAYSLDKGRTWQKAESNPVLPNPGIRDFRDPKVMWFESDKKWIMTLAVSDHVSFYSSPDLKIWTKESDFGADWGSHAGVWECPDLFEMNVQGADEKKWVLLVSINPGGPHGGSATQYFVGDFDGSQFLLDEDFMDELETDESPGAEAGKENAIWLDHGADNYAGVTWSDIPEADGRRLFIGWMSNWQYAQIVPTVEWRSAMTLPRSLTLNKNEKDYRIWSQPIEEISSIVQEAVDPEALSSGTYKITFDVDGDFELNLFNELKESVSIAVKGKVFQFDRSGAGVVDFHEDFGATHHVELETTIENMMVFVDRSSIEIFINGGEMVLTEIVFPNEPLLNIDLSGSGNNLKVQPITSIWK